MTTTRIPEEKRMDAEIRIYRLSPGDAFYAMGHRWVVVWPMWNTSGYASVAGRRFVSLEEAVAACDTLTAGGPEADELRRACEKEDICALKAGGFMYPDTARDALTANPDGPDYRRPNRK